MSIHPFIKRDPAQPQSSPTDPLRAFSEQFWEDEDEHQRPSVTWWNMVVAAVALLMLLGLLMAVVALVPLALSLVLP